MTETSMIASNPYDGERRPGTVGFALPGVSVRIADPESGAPVPAGGVGVIEVKGPNVFAGYWRMPEKTAQEFRADGFFITGDVGRVDADGYLHIVGRAKDLIISGGFNVYPKEVESEIDAIDGVLESAVFGAPACRFRRGRDRRRRAASRSGADGIRDPRGARRPAWPNSRRRSASSSSNRCRATPWARCRRRRCARPIRTFIAPDACSSLKPASGSGMRKANAHE